MTTTLSALARTELTVLAALAAISADGSTATPMDTTQYEGMGAFTLFALTGGSGALDTFLEESDASGSGYTDIPSTRLIKEDGTTANYAQITTGAAAEQRFVNFNECKKYVRVRNDVTGSTSVTRGVLVHGQKKYQT